MKHLLTNLRAIVLTSGMGLAMGTNLSAQTTAFTYQGRLNDGANPASGIYDLRFAIYDSPSGGAQQGNALTNFAVAVSNGLFNATLDFGNEFSGADRWLEIAVRTNGGGTFAPLSPRQAIASAPYAIRSGTAGALDGVLPGAQLAGNYGNAVTFSNAVNRFSGAFDGNGGGLTNVNAATLGGLGSGAFWQRAGNGGTTPGTDFLGTTDNQPLELKVNNQVALRLEPADGETANLVGGSPLNAIADGVRGSVIAGGGGILIGSSGEVAGTNYIAADYSTIGGGLENRVSTNSPGSTIAGGRGNLAEFNAFGSTIGGGQKNLIGAGAYWATIGGGYGHSIHTNANRSVIAGGGDSTIGTNSSAATIGGGYYNRIENDSHAGTIAGGQFQVIGTNSAWSTIAGGMANEVWAGSKHAVISGGLVNTIETDSTGAVIGGGQRHRIAPGAAYSVVGGGQYNQIGDFSAFGTVGGGSRNTNAGVYATVPGGTGNRAAAHALAAGTGAKANHQGSFVWADSVGGDFASSKMDELAARASGGVRFETAGSGMTVDGQPVLAGGVNAGQLSGPYTNAVTFGNGANAFTGTFTGNGSGINSVNATTVGGVPAANLWQLGGNSGTAAGTHFLGTTDNAPVEIKVNGMRALRLEPTGDGSDNGTAPDGAPNVIGGSPSNFVAAGAVGATIAGGGATNFGGGDGYNSSLSDYTAIGGGVANRIQADSPLTTIAGGLRNTIGGSSSESTIAGGWMNSLGTGCVYASVGGGRENSIADQVTGGTIAGGAYNDIFSRAANSTVGGGNLNTIGADSWSATIAGGRGNTIGTNAKYSAVGGGRQNIVSSNVVASAIAGGENNAIGAYSSDAAIAGGSQNNVGTNSSWSTVSGGGTNNIENNSTFSTIAGGRVNSIGTNSHYVAIGGGYTNTVSANSIYSTIAGGWLNLIGTNSTYGAIGGGGNNTITAGSTFGTIAGGRLNVLLTGAEYSTIAGGFNNSIGAYAHHATVAGGIHNHAAGDYSFAAGRRAHANHAGAFVWADSTDADIGSTAGNQFVIRASGGMRLQGGDNWDLDTTEGDLRIGNNSYRLKIGVAFSGGGAGDVWIRAHGGTGRMNIKNPGGMRIFSNEAESAGVNLAAGGGSWTSLSDRNAKENFTPVNPREVLEKVAALPVQMWNYKSQEAAVRHIGPVSQDFKAAFGVGESATGITVVDADGVALAAIQGLNQKVEAESQKSEVRYRRSEDSLRRLETENMELKARLEKMERLLSEKLGGAQ